MLFSISSIPREAHVYVRTERASPVCGHKEQCRLGNATSPTHPNICNGMCAINRLLEEACTCGAVTSPFKRALYNTRYLMDVTPASTAYTLPILFDWADSGALATAWSDRTYRMSNLGHFTPLHYDYMVQQSVTYRQSASSMTTTAHTRIVAVTESQLTTSVGDQNGYVSHQCPAHWKTVPEGSDTHNDNPEGGPGFIQYNLHGHATLAAKTYTMTFCEYFDVPAHQHIVVSGSEKLFLFVQNLDLAPTTCVAGEKCMPDHTCRKQCHEGQWVAQGQSCVCGEGGLRDNQGFFNRDQTTCNEGEVCHHSTATCVKVACRSGDGLAATKDMCVCNGPTDSEVCTVGEYCIARANEKPCQRKCTEVGGGRSGFSTACIGGDLDTTRLNYKPNTLRVTSVFGQQSEMKRRRNNDGYNKNYLRL